MKHFQHLSAALSLLVAIAGASPIDTTTLEPRAGAPLPKPIPSDCRVADALSYHGPRPCSSPARYRPTPSTLSGSLYGYYLQPDSAEVTKAHVTTLVEECVETCYGYGDIGDCKSIYLAYDYPEPPMFGGPGGGPSVACLLFSQLLNVHDFEKVPVGTTGYENSTARNIVCLSS